jgi:hypothetical protein
MPEEGPRHHLFLKEMGIFFIHPENNFPTIFSGNPG